MSNGKAFPVVNSYNEWDPLEEVIVGNALGMVADIWEPLDQAYSNVPKENMIANRLDDELLQKAQSQLDNLAKVLEKEGIKVVRPKPIETFIPVKTPDFEAHTGSTPCSRDVLIVFGDEIVEAPMGSRYRYYDQRIFRELVKEYFKKGARWTMAPKPYLSDESYNLNYNSKKKFDPDSHSILTEFEPCFDAASIMRFGKDIFYQRDRVTNNFGMNWLKRHLGDKYRLHELVLDHTQKGYVPYHLDTTIVPIRPGLALTNPTRIIKNQEVLDIFKQNGWELIDAPDPQKEDYSPDTSKWISMNLLSLDESKVVVEETEEIMIKFLESLGLKVITCPFKLLYTLGGGVHCCTTDIRRRGELKSYFPSLD